MNKIINWVGGSFFRTIGRILVYILLGFLLSYLLKDVELPSLFYVLKPIDVDARTYWPDSSDIDFKVNDSILTTTNKLYTSAGNITFRAISDEGFSYLGTNDQISYGYYSICASSKFNLTTYNSGSYSKNVKVYMTDIPCQIYNTTAYSNSRVLYMTFDLNIFGNSDSMCTASVSGSTTCELNNRITVYVPTAQEWSLNSYGFASTPFEFDESSGTLINQNTTIINQNNQMINKIDTMVSSQNATTSAIQNQTQQQHADSQAQIDNANQNTQAQIDSQKVCSTQRTSYSSSTQGYRIAGNNGQLIADSNYGATDFFDINESSKITVLQSIGSSSANVVFYDSNYNYVSSTPLSLVSIGTELVVPSGVNYARFTIYKTNYPILEIRTCKNGNQATNDKLDDMNDTLNNSDTSEATSSADDFFSNFTTNQHGLTGIITAPLSAIQSLTSKTCSPLILPLPFVNQNLELPCMRTIYDEHFGSFMTLYDTITLGIISYWVMVRIFALVKDFKNPEHDEIEVVDL